MSVQLFKHNKETYENMVKMFETENRVGVVQPTGSGKSFLYLKWIEDNQNDKICLFSPSTEIFEQLYRYAEDENALDILSNVRCITYQTLLNMTEDEIAALKLDKIVFDEFHRTGADLWGPKIQQMLDIYPEAKVFGATATPIRYLDEGRNMADEIFDNKLARYMTLGEAVEKDILPMPKYLSAYYDIDGDFDKKIAKNTELFADSEQKEEYLEKVNELKKQLENSYGVNKIFKENMPHDHGKFLVFCKDEEHLNAMQESMKDWLMDVNSNVHMYTSLSKNDKDNKQLHAFINDNDVSAIKLLFSVDRFNEGLHVEGVDGIVMLRPTESLIVYLQQLGRALVSGKDSQPLVFDLVNNFNNARIYDEKGQGENVFVRDFLEYASDSKKNAFEKFGLLQKQQEFSSLMEQLNDSFDFDNEKRWQQMFDLYVEFKNEFGREPKTSEVYEDVNLGNWVATQRQLYNAGKLDSIRTEKLLSVGFDFVSRKEKDDARWQKTFDLYVEFKNKYGREPKTNEEYKDVNLGNWVSNQRQLYKNGKLDPIKTEKLLSTGMVFVSKFDAQWQETFDLYVEFKNKHGKEPQNYEEYKGVKLGKWVLAQRGLYKDGKLDPIRKEKLLSVGFDFVSQKEKNDAQWQETFDLYVEFKNTYGRDPKQKDEFKGVNLGTWVLAQRGLYKDGKLDPARTEKLLSVGFDFVSRKEKDAIQWQERFELYVEFKNKYGREPKPNEEYKGVSLGNWVLTQRQLDKDGNLDTTRKEKLSNAGMVFNSKFGTRWQETFDLYVEFKNKYGREPQKYEEYKGVKLGYWVLNQRKLEKDGKLDPARTEKLLSVDFDFVSQKEKEDARWQEIFDLYAEFKNKYGREPKRREEYKGVNLGLWVSNQRKLYKDGKLDPAKKEKLSDAGFVFDAKTKTSVDDLISNASERCNDNSGDNKSKSANKNCNKDDFGKF